MQCVTVPKILNDTDTETFFRHQIFSIPIPVLFLVPNFSDTGFKTFLIKNLPRRYPSKTHETTMVIVLLFVKLYLTRSLGRLRGPTSSWRPWGLLDFVLTT